MSTRSRISIINKDGTARSIYCHWDGYLDYNGAILKQFYTDADRINKLMDLGDISELGIKPESSPEMWNNPAAYLNQYITKAYRDRGETGVSALKFDSAEKLFDWLHDDNCEEYNYLFVDGKWYYWKGNQDPADMKELPEISLPDLVKKSLSVDELAACEHNPEALNNK